jgi:hypothetical protein
MYKQGITRTAFTTFSARQISLQKTRHFALSAAKMSRISDAITKDHRELEQYYNKITQAKDDDEATRWQNQFTWELARHSIGEELVVYPAFERKLGDKGKKMAQKDRDEHQAVGTYSIIPWGVLTFQRLKNNLKSFKT